MTSSAVSPLTQLQPLKWVPSNFARKSSACLALHFSCVPAFAPSFEVDISIDDRFIFSKFVILSLGCFLVVHTDISLFVEFLYSDNHSFTNLPPPPSPYRPSQLHTHPCPLADPRGRGHYPLHDSALHNNLNQLLGYKQRGSNCTQQRHSAAFQHGRLPDGWVHHLSMAMAGDSLGITGTNGQAMLAESAYGMLMLVLMILVGKHYLLSLSYDKD